SGAVNLNSIGVFFSVLLFLLAAYHFSIAGGMFMLKNWARILYLVNTWISIVFVGLGMLISLVMIFFTGPIALVNFLFNAIIVTINIFIVKYLYKSEIADLFTLNNQQSDSYSLASDFDDNITDEQSGILENDTFGSVSSKIEIEPTYQSRQVEMDGKTKALEERSPIIAMLIEDQKNGQYRNYDILKKRTSIGRASTNDITIKNEQTLGRQHAHLIFKQGKFWIHDLASTNGTYVNGKKVEKHDLIEGDELRLGNLTFIFKTIN
ncbi:MAG: FHA domain-containing protein, partial [Calditrichales bacterium]|nr:FHA domain-containing protein [Calditrichales bacterium]